MKTFRTSRVIPVGAGVLALATILSMSAANADTPHRSAELATREQALQQGALSVVATEATGGKQATPIEPSMRPAVTDDDLSSTAALGAGATFVPINPYRAIDSRAFVDGFLTPGDEVFFDVITDVNGVPQIPDTAVAVTYNLTATGTFGAEGYLAVFPADINWPGNSSINWFASGISLANGGVVALGNLDAPGQISVYCGNVAQTGSDYIVDITGYYVI